MKRLAGGLMVLALVGGGASALAGPFMASYWNKGQNCSYGNCHSYPTVPEAIGPWGQPVPMVRPYSARPPDGTAAARAMLAQSVPLDIVQVSGLSPDGSIPGAVGPGMTISPPSVGAMPMVTPDPRGPAGPMPPSGIQQVNYPGPPGAVAAMNALTGHGQSPFQAGRSEVRFVGPAGMKISWYGPSPAAAGKGGFATNYIEAPGRYNFVQAGIYRLKLSDIPNRPGLELYPTLEVVPANAKTATFLAHAAVPVVFTEEDFEQVSSGNFVVKVIYLPDPRFQDLATTGPDEVVSSRLEPGVDPIAEACRRGSILLIVRLGNIDLEAPNTPAMDAPSPYMPKPPAGHGAMPGPMGAGPMMPPGMMPPGMMAGPGGPMMPPAGGMMPPGGPMPPQMLPPPGMVPGMPANMVPQPPPQPAPAGPVGQAAPAGAQPVGYTVPAGRAPTPAELAAQGATPAKPAPQRRGLFSWGSDASKSSGK